MKLTKTLVALMLAAALLGCRQQPGPHHIVILQDVSGSIDRNALELAFKAIDELVGHLKRGDRIAIIPILGDAQAEVSGRIIRFQVPTNRQAYDSDLHHFAVQLRSSLEDLKSSTMKHPAAKTDILGSISLAEQEFQADPSPTKDSLLVLSDFIYETDEINFRRDKHLENKAAAEELAEQIAKREGLNLKGVSVYLGLLGSREYAGLNRGRRVAIQAFWVRYFNALGSKPNFVTDGVGLVKRCLDGW